jgi:tetratricopeptide (TPR) repeat protein
MSDEEMRQDLQLMGRSALEHITNDIARDVCIREGDKAMIFGSIASLGKRYTITLQSSSCQTGDVLARGQVEAQDKEHVLKAIRTAGGDMRVKLGESLSSLQKLDKPFIPVTTPSLDAFRAFVQGQWEYYHEGSDIVAARLLREATQLEPNFALAFDFLGGIYNHLRDYEHRNEVTKKAFSLINHVHSERERLNILAEYYLWVTGEIDKTYDIGQLMVRAYPRDEFQHNGMGYSYYLNGELEKFLDEYQKAFRLSHPVLPVHFYNLVFADTVLGRLEEAKALAQTVLAQRPDDPIIHDYLLVFAYIAGDRDAAVKEIQWFVGKPEETDSLFRQAENAYSLGQRRKAKELYSRGIEVSKRWEFPGRDTWFRLSDAVSDAVLGNCRAMRDSSEAVTLIERNRDQFQPPILGLALCGEAAQVQLIADKISKKYPLDTLWNRVKLPAIRAAVELGQSHYAKAVELLQSAAPYERTYPYVIYLRGLAYLGSNEGTKAMGEFRKILDNRSGYWILGFHGPGPYYSLSYLGLARAEVLSGDRAKAKKAYEDFLTLWKDADPDLRDLVQARKEYAVLQ